MKNIKVIYPLLAKVGHKIIGSKDEQAVILWEHYYDSDIQTYEMKRLSTLQDILYDTCFVDDLIMLIEKRKYSLDYDYKREVLKEGFTKPHQNINDFKRFRSVVNNLREKRHERATHENVAYYQSRAKQNVRSRGTAKADCVRHFLRGLVQGVKPFKKHCNYIDISKRLREFNVTVDACKNAKRVPFVSNVIFNSSSNRNCIRKILQALGYQSEDKYQAWLDLLIHKGLSNPVTMYQ